ncbi:MAG: methyltransferase domain-containing protein [Dehalococcoidales bacterium]|nr:methyltransferase domain-containing protein [Dehalococcoidales bacterium]
MVLKVSNDLDKHEIKDFWEQGPPMGFIGEEMTYDEKREFRYSFQDYMHEIFKFEEFAGKSVLEIGCGGGLDSAEFARNGAQVTSTDFTSMGVKTTTELLQQAGLPVNVQQADATDLQFEDNSFDCVYTFGVLHHIPDIGKALSEIKRVLKPGGQLMAMIYNRNSLLYAYSILYLHGFEEKQLETLTIDELNARYSERKEDNPYTKVYTKNEAKVLFSEYFDSCTVDVRYNVIDMPSQRKVKVIVSDDYELGWHLIVKGFKPLG